jgi:diguanylate cyclase (GGDEF)-like protein
MIPASLLFIDLDNFKPINDTYGHAEGDRVLAAFAKQLKNTFRKSDIVARLGGDEFVVLLTNSTKKRAEKLVSRLFSALNDKKKKERMAHDITFSHGIVEFDPDEHHTVEALLAESDSIMYEAKQTKRH